MPPVTRVPCAIRPMPTDGAASAEPNLFELCRVVTEEGGSQFARGEMREAIKSHEHETQFHTHAPDSSNYMPFPHLHGCCADTHSTVHATPSPHGVQQMAGRIPLPRHSLRQHTWMLLHVLHHEPRQGRDGRQATRFRQGHYRPPWLHIAESGRWQALRLARIQARRHRPRHNARHWQQQRQPHGFLRCHLRRGAHNFHGHGCQPMEQRAQSQTCLSYAES